MNGFVSLDEDVLEDSMVLRDPNIAYLFGYCQVCSTKTIVKRRLQILRGRDAVRMAKWLPHTEEQDFRMRTKLYLRRMACTKR